MAAPGEKAQLLTALDNHAAENLQPLYIIDLQLEKSPRGVKCGGITVWKLNDEDFGLDLDEGELKERLEASRTGMESWTEKIWRDPVLFRETDGRWIPWALRECLALFDKLNGDACVRVKSSRLKFRQVVSAHDIRVRRSNLRQLFAPVFDADRLLDAGYRYDPWSDSVRRGRISAKLGKR